MIVHTYTKRYDSSTSVYKEGDTQDIWADRIEFCCDGMQLAFENDFIGFGEKERMLNKNKNVNIYSCAPYPEGAVWDECAIKFCPFCSLPVEIK